MKLSGTLEENLRAAVTSAERLRDRPVYRETVAHWRELLSYAREIGHGRQELDIQHLISKLQDELVRREPDA